MTRTRSGLACALAVVAGLALYPAATRAQDADTRLILSWRLANAGQRANFLGDLQYNCNLLFSNNLAPTGRGRWVYATAVGPAVGTPDLARGRGEAFTKRSRWQVEALPPSHARPTVFADLGVSLRGSTVFLTGRVTHGRPLLAASRRVRLAIMRGAKIENGPLVDRRNRPVANTFTYLATGRLKMLPAMSRALERTRCKDRSRNRLSRRLKPGYPLGLLSVGFRPDRATGLAGDAQLATSAATTETDEPVTVQPGAGAGADGQGKLVTPITTGLPAPLTCAAGDGCLPSGGSVGLGGGFDLLFGGRRTSVANIVVTTTGTPPNALRQTVTGTLDGAPVTIAEGSGIDAGLAFTDDFAQRAGAALGAEISGGLAVQLRFARTGP